MRTNDLNNIPIEQHWAIITTSQIHHAGDERSCTNPGHGYPAYSETVIQYEHFDDVDEWEYAIREHEAQSKSYRAMKVYPASVSTSVNVVVNVGD